MTAMMRATPKSLSIQYAIARMHNICKANEFFSLFLACVGRNPPAIGCVKSAIKAATDNKNV